MIANLAVRYLLRVVTRPRRRVLLDREALARLKIVLEHYNARRKLWRDEIPTEAIEP